MPTPRLRRVIPLTHLSPQKNRYLHASRWDVYKLQNIFTYPKKIKMSLVKKKFNCSGRHSSWWPFRCEFFNRLLATFSRHSFLKKSGSIFAASSNWLINDRPWDIPLASYRCHNNRSKKQAFHKLLTSFYFVASKACYKIVVNNKKATAE